MSNNEWVTEFWKLLKQDRWDECWPLLEVHYGEAEAWYLIGLCAPSKSERFHGPCFWIKAANMGHALASAACVRTFSLARRSEWMFMIQKSRNPLVQQIVRYNYGDLKQTWTTPDEAWLHVLYVSGDIQAIRIAADAGIPEAIFCLTKRFVNLLPQTRKRPQAWAIVEFKEWAVRMYYIDQMVMNWAEAANLVLANSFYSIMNDRTKLKHTRLPSQRLAEILVYGKAMTKGETNGHLHQPWIETYNHYVCTSVATLSLTYLSLCRDLCKMIYDLLWERVKK